MMSPRRLVAGLLACVLALSACGNSTDSTDAATEAAQSDIPLSSLSAGLTVTAAQLRADPTANTVISPASLQMAFAMLAAGVAVGSDAYNELSTFLGTKAAGSTTVYGGLGEALRTGQGLGVVDLATAWGIRTDGGADISRVSVEAVAQSLGSTVEEGKLADLQKALDAWTKSASRGLVKDLPPLADDVALVILASLYAQQGWAKKPDFALLDFHAAGGEVSTGPAMSWNDVSVHDSKAYDYAVIPFAGNLQFEALMPASGDLANLSVTDWEITPDATMKVELPHLELEGETNVAQMLGDLSLTSITDVPSAITGFTEDGEGLIPEVIAQKAVLKLDQEGIEAAAVTQIQAVPTMLPVAEPDVLRFDRPLAFRVTDKESGWVLFYGAVNNPNPS
ncbi:MAG: serpin family protein [Ancrocorticia sp.]